MGGGIVLIWGSSWKPKLEVKSSSLMCKWWLGSDIDVVSCSAYLFTNRSL